MTLAESLEEIIDCLFVITLNVDLSLKNVLTIKEKDFMIKTGGFNPPINK